MPPSTESSLNSVKVPHGYREKLQAFLSDYAIACFEQEMVAIVVCLTRYGRAHWGRLDFEDFAHETWVETVSMAAEGNLRALQEIAQGTDLWKKMLRSFCFTVFSRKLTATLNNQRQLSKLEHEPEDAFAGDVLDNLVDDEDRELERRREQRRREVILESDDPDLQMWVEAKSSGLTDEVNADRLGLTLPAFKAKGNRACKRAREAE